MNFTSNKKKSQGSVWQLKSAAVNPLCVCVCGVVSFCWSWNGTAGRLNDATTAGAAAVCLEEIVTVCLDWHLQNTHTRSRTMPFMSNCANARVCVGSWCLVAEKHKNRRESIKETPSTPIQYREGSGYRLVVLCGSCLVAIFRTNSCLDGHNFPDVGAPSPGRRAEVDALRLEKRSVAASGMSR